MGPRLSARPRERRRTASVRFRPSLSEGAVVGLESRSLAAPGVIRLWPWTGLTDLLGGSHERALFDPLTRLDGFQIGDAGAGAGTSPAPPVDRDAGPGAQSPPSAAGIIGSSPGEESPDVTPDDGGDGTSSLLSSANMLFLVTSPYPGLLAYHSGYSSTVSTTQTTPDLGLTVTKTDSRNYGNPVFASLSDSDTVDELIYAPGDTTTGASSLEVVANSDPTRTDLASLTNTDTCTLVADRSGTYYLSHTSAMQTGTTYGSPTPIRWDIGANHSYTGPLTMSGHITVTYTAPADTLLTMGEVANVSVISKLDILNSVGGVQSSLNEATASMTYDPSTGHNTTLSITTWQGGSPVNAPPMTNFSGSPPYGQGVGTTYPNASYPSTTFYWDVHVGAGQAPYGMRQSLQFLVSLNTVFNATSNLGTNTSELTWTFTIDDIQLS
jgi:hypothetical protein